MGEKMKAYRPLVGKSKGKRPLRRPRLRSEDNVKMNCGEIGWGVLTELACLRRGTSGKFL
jgi:hypothetical protein